MKSLRRPLAAAGLLVVLALNAEVLFVSLVNPAPPPRPGSTPVRDAKVTRGAGIHRLGPCWWRDHRGQHVMYLEGDPYTRGFCNAALADGILDLQHQALEEAFARAFPARVLRFLAARVFLGVYRDVPDHLADADRLAILGLSEGRPDPWLHLAPTYGRVIYYHAIHEISQAMVDSPMVACTTFGATGEHTARGQTLLARNFDFEGGRVFDEHKVVIFVKPRVGYAYAHVAWGGMAGVVSGMNETGLGAVLNAAGSARFDTKGRPTIFVLRSVLTHAATIDEAVDIVRRADVFISEIFTVADAKSGELAAIEITPDEVRVRRGAGRISATNHFLDPELGRDEHNRKRITQKTTGRRLSRLQELLANAGPLDVPKAIRILRDRALPGGRAAPLGHRGTIDPMIAAHSVVFDLTARTLYVSSSPHTLGEFVRYDFDEVMAGGFSDRGALPADAALQDGRYAGLREARRLVREARAAEDAPAEAMLRRALRRSPDYPPALLALARRCERAHKRDCARSAFLRYLATDPAYPRNAREAREALRQLGQPPPTDAPSESASVSPGAGP